MNEPVAVAVLAKAPIPGFAKTRLIPVLGAGGAAMLQGRLIERAVETACAAAVGPVSLWAAPDETHPAFQSISARLAITLARQADGDLGARMLAAITRSEHLRAGDRQRLPCPHTGSPAHGGRGSAQSRRRGRHSGGGRRLRPDRHADARTCAVLGRALEHARRHGRDPPPPQDARPDVARADHAVGRGPPARSRANAGNRPARPDPLGR